jgi:hypothetical protein
MPLAEVELSFSWIAEGLPELAKGEHDLSSLLPCSSREIEKSLLCILA